MVGSAIVRQIEKRGDCEVIARPRIDLDLRDQASVRSFFLKERIDEVYIAAAKVGGIYANNTYPADFLYDNLMIQSNVIWSAFQASVAKLIFLGSSCIYPRECSQPIDESHLLSGSLESTNEPYAIAKISGIKLCQSLVRQYGQEHGIDYRCVMPCNLYGPGDNYHPQNSHVIPGLIRRMHSAKLVNQSAVAVWGSGNPRREFLFVDDLARACVQLMQIDQKYFLDVMDGVGLHLNIGSGSDISIKELALLIREVVSYGGDINFDSSMPDGTMRKLMNSSRAHELGIRPQINIQDGLRLAYSDFLKSASSIDFPIT